MPKKYIDLTLDLQDGMRGFEKNPFKKFEKDGWNASMLNIYSHAGTHMDAPVHFNIEGKFINEFTPEQLCGHAHVVQLTQIPDKYLIAPSDVLPILEKIKPGDIVLFHTNWHKYVNEEKYRNALPRISVELAALLVQKRVKMIGVEPPSIADVNNLEELKKVHQILFEGQVIIVEGLANLNKLSKDEVEFFALPIKIFEGDGAPCRAFAIENID